MKDTNSETSMLQSTAFQEPTTKDSQSNNNVGTPTLSGDRSAHPFYLTKSQLKDRGWTDSLIRKFLSEADKTRTNPHYRSGPPMRLYV